MTEARRTPFQNKLRTFADIHRAGQEDWVLALFQRLCVSVQSVNWTSPQFDESKLSVAQNLVCVDKCYKKWREDVTSLGINNPRSPKSTPFHASSAPTASYLTNKNTSASPPQFGSSGLLKKIEGMDIADTDDSNISFIPNPADSTNPDPQQKTSPTNPASPLWTSPDPTRNKYDSKKKHVEILNYTIESKLKAIKAIVERTARGIQEKRYALRYYAC